jgi:hypothetical protein
MKTKGQHKEGRSKAGGRTNLLGEKTSLVSFLKKKSCVLSSSSQLPISSLFLAKLGPKYKNEKFG